MPVHENEAAHRTHTPIPEQQPRPQTPPPHLPTATPLTAGTPHATPGRTPLTPSHQRISKRARSVDEAVDQQPAAPSSPSSTGGRLKKVKTVQTRSDENERPVGGKVRDGAGRAGSVGNVAGKRPVRYNWVWKPDGVDRKGKQWTNDEKALLFESTLGPDGGRIYNYVIKNNKEGFKLVSPLCLYSSVCVFIVGLSILDLVGENFQGYAIC